MLISGILLSRQTTLTEAVPDIPSDPPITADNDAICLRVGRRGLARFLFSVLRSRDAGAAVVDASTLRLARGSRHTEIPLGNIKSVDLNAGRKWARLRLRHTTGAAVVSGLPPEDARAFVQTLERARVDWWRRTLASRIETLRRVSDRLVEFADPQAYLTRSAFAELVRDAEGAAGHFVAGWPDTLSHTPEVRMLRTILDFLEDTGGFREKANAAFVANELERSREFFDRIEAWPLTEEQRRAVVIDGDRNLVVAAAGSGKTSAIVAKAGWLLHRGYRRPRELLLLAFARDASGELEERVRKCLGDEAARGMTVSTFHALGLAIVGKVEGRRPALAKVAEDDRALLHLLKGIVADLVAEKEVSETVLDWFQEQFAPYRSQHEFRSWGEYWDYIRRHQIRSLKGERVKSFEECEIANFLYLHGVDYEYERVYVHDTSTSEKGRYRPDFYLPESGIWIEHFGIDAEGRTAPFVPQEEYLESMAWKRALHEKHGTTLIETFSHERAAGSLIRNLEAKLRGHGLTLIPVQSDKAFATLEEQGWIDPFMRLVATFLQHFKGARLTIGDVMRRAGTHGDRHRAEAFRDVFGPIFERYQETLARSDEIDFHDMIDRAADHVEAGRFHSPFGYILVDEFQDISPARTRLLKALLDRSPGAKLFAVGDDWQAIFRFAGSDIDIMRRFEEHLGEGERLYLETTFRCADRIAEVATDFVLRNPSQIPKTVRSNRRSEGPAVHVGLSGDRDLPVLKEALDRIAEDAARHDGTSSVLLLGRYNHLRPQNLAGLKRHYTGLRFGYMTVHKSKGLEADYVVVLGLCSGKYGFPAEMADDPLLDLVLAVPESHPNAEERRLLYVAITRARRRVYLLAEGGVLSPFASELIGGQYDVAVFGRSPEQDVPCPLCVEGRLTKREYGRNGGTFFGCSNYPYCGHMQRPCPACGEGLLVKVQGKFQCRDCGQSIEACPDCDSWLVTRMGRYGRFLGCSNYPACDYTRNLQQRNRRRGIPDKRFNSGRRGRR